MILAEIEERSADLIHSKSSTMGTVNTVNDQKWAEITQRVNTGEVGSWCGNDNEEKGKKKAF